MVKQIDHIGIAVKSIENSLSLYTDIFGLQFLGIEEVESEQVKVAFLKAGDVKIELLEPLQPTSPIQKFIETKGEGIHHIALRVESIDESMEEMKNKGLNMINDRAKTGAGGALVAFIHPKSTGRVLFELCERK